MARKRYVRTKKMKGRLGKDTVKASKDIVKMTALDPLKIEMDIIIGRRK